MKVFPQVFISLYEVMKPPHFLHSFNGLGVSASPASPASFSPHVDCASTNLHFRQHLESFSSAGIVCIYNFKKDNYRTSLDEIVVNYRPSKDIGNKRDRSIFKLRRGTFQFGQIRKLGFTESRTSSNPQLHRD